MKFPHFDASSCNQAFAQKKASLAERPGGGWEGREVGVYLFFPLK
jgi:hypothetical protein